jgi:multidrug efflux pump subunit AcrA (membrane-fusion protein)
MQRKRQVIAGVLIASLALVAVGMTVHAVYFNGVQTLPGTVQSLQRLDLNFQNPGRLSEMKVQAGDHVTAGQTLAIQDGRVLDLNLQAAKSTLAGDQANLQLVQSPQLLPAEQDQIALQIAKAQQQVTAAQVAASDASQLANSIMGQAQQNVDAVQGTLTTNQDSYTQQCGSDQLALSSQVQHDCQQMASEITHNQQLLSQAQADVPHQTALAQQYVDLAGNTLAQNQAALRIAQNDLVLRTTPRTPAEIAVATARVAQDQAQVGLDQKAVADAVITAPTDGVIAQVNGAIGDLVGDSGVHNYGAPQSIPQGGSKFSLFPPAPSTATSTNNNFLPLLSLQPQAGWRILAQVPEEAISKMYAGRLAEVTFPALKKTVYANVAQTIPIPLTVDGVVNYQVVLKPRNQVDGILPGMSATISP